jgi:hypothetical protein
MKSLNHRLLFGVAAFALCLPALAGRITVSLNGTWEIEESVAVEQIPSAFGHKILVPGLIHSAEPPFPDAGAFAAARPNGAQAKPASGPAGIRSLTRGTTAQTRNFFWYQLRFRVPAKKQVALLSIGKAQFGTAVWLNGKKVGEHLGCFTAGHFDLTKAIDWNGENQLLVRVGAHPAVLPDTVPSGTDPSRRFWKPGIYDNVALILADNPVIETVQVAPRIQSSEIVIQTEVHNFGPATAVTLRHQLRGSGSIAERINLNAGERKLVRQTLKLPSPNLWSPENPHLYYLDTSTGGDSVTTRFGMRELRFDTATKRAYLNGKVYFFRGSNVALHRFFEDPKCGRLPWDEKWVRRVMGEIPKSMNWNSIRFHVGPPPDLWLDLADELGILVFNEYPIFGFREEWSDAQLTEEYREWMRDQWNHPSIGLWDASNESRADRLSSIIRAVRRDDLSNRAWDNGYNLPAGPDDPVEDHPYLFIGPGRRFNLPDLEKMTGSRHGTLPHPTGHPVIINEYEWLWLQSDGTPTQGTREVWSHLLPAGSTADDHFALHGYLVAGITEFWRAYRNAVGVIHFSFLSYSVPYSNSSGCFSDIENLVLEPHFADYAKEAFRPLGVYLNFWQPTVPANSQRRVAVMMVNDEYEASHGILVLSLHDAEGRELSRTETQYEVAALGQQTYELQLQAPAVAGQCLLKAVAYPAGEKTPTVSRRRFSVVVE